MSEKTEREWRLEAIIRDLTERYAALLDQVDALQLEVTRLRQVAEAPDTPVELQGRVVARGEQIVSEPAPAGFTAAELLAFDARYRAAHPEEG